MPHAFLATRSDPARFAAVLSEFKRVSRWGFSLVVLSEEEYRTSVRTYLTADERAGFSINDKGRLQSVFTFPGSGHRGADLVEDALAYGATTLGCWDHPFLIDFYTRLGFVETSRIAFNDKYAIPGWDYTAYENPRPDLVDFRIARDAA